MLYSCCREDATGSSGNAKGGCIVLVCLLSFVTNCLLSLFVTVELFVIELINSKLVTNFL